MNNLIQFPNGSTISISESNDFEKLTSLGGICFIDALPEEIVDNRVFTSLASFMKRNELSSEEKLESILDNQARINYYLSEIEMFGPAKF